MKQIVVIGAGYAGVLTAKKLLKRTRKSGDVKITLIDKNPFHTMLTELHEVAAGRVEEDSIRIPLKKVFAGRGVRVVQDTVTGVDYDDKTVHGEAGDYPYDALVMATGSHPTFFGVEGAVENAFTLWSYDDAVRLKERFHRQMQKAAAAADGEEKKRLLSFFVVGAGFTGVEMAGELAEYMPILCREYGIDPHEVSLCEVDLLTRVVPTLPEKLSAKAEKRLKKMGVRLMLQTNVNRIGADSITVTSGERTETLPAGTVIWAAGIEGSRLVFDAAESLKVQKRGRIETDEYLRAAGRADVFVAGDNIWFVPAGEKDAVPQMVENAEHSADTVAHNLLCGLYGNGEMEAYSPKFHGMMVSIGGRYGVARVGLPGHMVNLPSFLAMLSKHFINVIYFIQVLGWNKVFSYLKHEFFTIRHCRSFLGGHFSNRTPSFMLVPLRVFLGAVWLFEGLVKIFEGWLSTPMLQSFFGGANAFYNSILLPLGAPAVGGAAGASATTVVDAVTAATGMVEATGRAIFDWRLFGLFDVIFVSANGINMNDLALRFDVPVINWFINSLLLPSEGFQMFMQISIVLAEILLGLALIGGLLTTPAAAVSLVLQGMFLCTTGLYLNTVWMIPAGIAMLFGAGYSLGLDYYFMPWLKRQWAKIPFVKKWYLYHD